MTKHIHVSDSEAIPLANLFVFVTRFGLRTFYRHVYRQTLLFKTYTPFIFRVLVSALRIERKGERERKVSKIIIS